jgi:large subunit ribosomal protein L18
MERRRRRDLAKSARVPTRDKVILFRSNKHIYASVIRDGKTLMQVSTLGKEVPENLKGRNNIEACQWVASKLADRLKDMRVETVFISKSGYKFHGGVRKLIEIVRERGLQC